jgi:hypothetical protein
MFDDLNKEKFMKTILASLVFFGAVFSTFAVQPNWTITPGVLCSRTDPDYAGDRYAEHIPYCGRNISHDEKLRVAQAYGGIPESEWSHFEFDHLIPLAAGGSNDIGNLWPQPILEARQKDVLEDQVFLAMRAGRMSQQEAVRRIIIWTRQH